MMTGQGYGMGIGGCNSLCSTTTGLSLVALFSLSVSIEDRPLHWTLVKSQTYYPEHVLGYRSGKACYSLVVGSSSFRTDWLETRIGEGLITALTPGLKRGGIESKFGWEPGPLNWSGMGWSCLCLEYQRSMRFSRYLARHIDSHIAVSTWRYDLTTVWHRSKNWNMKDDKRILIA
jgi:hypothetical protein